MNSITTTRIGPGTPGRADDRAGHPVRRLRHPAVAGVARELPEAVLAAGLRPLADPGDRAARPRPGLRGTGRGLQPGAPLPGRRAAARRRASRARASCSSRSGRNTAPAIAAAALLVAEQNPDAVLWMMAADAAITDLDGAAQAARRPPSPPPRGGRIVTFGMKPTGPRPATATSRSASRSAGSPGVHALARFVEKPDARDRRRAGRRRPASVELRHVRLHRRDPDRGDAAARAGGAGRRPPRGRERARSDLDFIRLDPEAFAACPTSASTTRWPSAPTAPPWCRPISAGPMSAAGTRCGSSATRTPPATSRRRRAAGGGARTATSAATASSPPWSASRTPSSW